MSLPVVQPLFLRIVEGVNAYDNYFMPKRECIGLLGFASLKKFTFIL